MNPKSIVLVALILLGLALCSCGHFSPSAKEPGKVPPDFTLNYEEGPGQDGQGLHRFIRIRPIGDTGSGGPGFKLFHGAYTVPLEPPDAKKDEMVLPAATLTNSEVLPLYKAVRRNRFFDLEKQYRDPGLTRGRVVSLEIKAEGQAHKVVVVEAGPERFTNILLALRDLVKSKIKNGVLSSRLFIDLMI